jgi:hypothetical protein
MKDMSPILNEDTGQTEASSLEELLGLPEGFLSELVSESDWTFVIKIESFLEALLSHILTEVLEKPALQEAFSHLDMGNKKAGKIALTYKLKLISKGDRNFLDALIELRNQFAHNIIYVNYTLKDYFDHLQASQANYFFKKLVMYFAYIIPKEYINTPELQDALVEVEHLGKTQPKIAIWLSVMTFTKELYERKETHLALHRLRQKLYWSTRI